MGSPNLLPASEDRRDDLLRALSRRDQLGAMEILAKICREPTPPSDLMAWGRSHHPGKRFAYDPDKEWLLRSVTHHVADGRFEHAAILVERYSGCHVPGACPTAPDLMTFRPAQQELDTGDHP